MLLQLTVNGLIVGCMYALIAVGFSMIYRTCRFFHFAHAIVMVIGAYAVYGFHTLIKLPLLPATLLAIVTAGIIGWLMSVVIYRRMLRDNALLVVLMLASLGLYIVLQNVISMLFGDDLKTIYAWPVLDRIFQLGSVRLTGVQVAIIIITLGSVLLLTWLFRRTRWGLQVRALGDNRQLLATTGIDTRLVMEMTFLIASGFAGMAGVLMIMDRGMLPTSGFHILLMGVVTMIIGGGNSYWGALVGGLVIGIGENMVLAVANVQWQEMLIFAIMFVYLLASPRRNLLLAGSGSAH